MLPTLPESANNSRAQYQHRARKLAETPQQRARAYFTSAVDPVISELLASIANSRPDDVMSYIFAWSRRQLTERQLVKRKPDVVVNGAGVQIGVDTNAISSSAGCSNNMADMDAAAVRVQSVQRRRVAQEVVQTKKLEKSAATKVQAIERGRQSRRKSAVISGSKAKKMGSLLLKAQKEGNLEAAVEDMEKAGIQ